jgi:hypothetical protein
MISYMMVRCICPPQKTCCIKRCRSRSLQVQVQDVENRRRWSSALLDEARLVLSVRRIQTGNVRRRVSQSFVRGRWLAPHQASPVLLVVRHSRSVVLIEVKRATCKIHISAGHSNWTYSDITIWTTAGNPTVHTQLVLQLVVSEYAKQRAQMQLLAIFSRTEEFEELLQAWMQSVLEHSSFHHWFWKFSIQNRFWKFSIWFCLHQPIWF